MTVIIYQFVFAGLLLLTPCGTQMGSTANAVTLDPILPGALWTKMAGEFNPRVYSDGFWSS
jgi:hypothetical protein